MKGHATSQGGPHTQGHQNQSGGWVKENEGGPVSTFIVVPLGRDGQDRAGKTVNKLSVGRLNNFRGPWCVGAASASLVPGPGGWGGGESRGMSVRPLAAVVGESLDRLVCIWNASSQSSGFARGQQSLQAYPGPKVSKHRKSKTWLMQWSTSPPHITKLLNDY